MLVPTAEEEAWCRGEALGDMEGPSSRRDGAPRLLDARRRSAAGDGDSEPGRDVKTHFRVCRFIMDSGELRSSWVSSQWAEWFTVEELERNRGRLEEDRRTVVCLDSCILF